MRSRPAAGVAMLSIVGDILVAWVGTGAEGKTTSAGARGLPRDRGRHDGRG